jgi:hypothetical protein
MTRIDSEADFFVMKPMVSLCVMAGSDATDSRRNPMAFRPFVSQLSVVTAYIAFAFVGAIVLGMF